LASEKERFRDLFRQVRQYPLMYLAESRYAVLVAFVTGCDEGTDRRLLDGFGEWVAQRVLGRETPFVWWTVIASQHAPDLLDGHHPISSLSAEQDQQASESLSGLLDEFLDA
jgi:hypothetical protein